MYKKLTKPLPPKHGRMYVDKQPPDMGPPRPNDIVTVSVAENVDFYIHVKATNGSSLDGEIWAIGPSPREEYDGWSCGDLISVEEAAVKAIIRGD